MIFDINKMYIFHTKPWIIDCLSEHDLQNLNSNHAGALSHIREIRIANIFSNLQRGTNNDKFDYLNTFDNTFLEQRTINKKYKTNLIPSYMIGAGRLYDNEKFILKLNSIKGFIFSIPFSHNKEIIFGVQSEYIFNDGNPYKELNSMLISQYTGFKLKELEEMANNVIEGSIKTIAYDNE